MKLMPAVFFLLSFETFGQTTIPCQDGIFGMMTGSVKVSEVILLIDQPATVLTIGGKYSGYIIKKKQSSGTVITIDSKEATVVDIKKLDKPVAVRFQMWIWNNRCGEKSFNDNFGTFSRVEILTKILPPSNKK